MQNLSKLIDQFRAEDTEKLEDIDSSAKIGIIFDLEEFADEALVQDFFLSVAIDENEYDLARIEVFKIFYIKFYDNLELRDKYAAAIRQVLSQSKDDGVRHYAAKAAASYMYNEEVFEEMNRILHDKTEDIILRWNAFGAMESYGASPRSVDSFRKLLVDDEFRESAARVLSEWAMD